MRIPLVFVLVAVSVVGLTAACNRSNGGGSNPVDYEAVFVQDRIVNWNISIPAEIWNSMPSSPDTYVPADVEVDGETYPQVGIKLMGNAAATKKSLRVDFLEFQGRRFHGLKRINLRNMAGDPTLVREALAYKLMRDASVPASRTSFVWVCINDQGCGLHTLVEQVDKKFLEDRFDGDDFGNLYKVERGGTLVYKGDATADYPELIVYEKKTNAAEDDFSDLFGLMRVLSDAGPLEAQLPTVLDVDGFLTAMAVNTWLSNLNSYPGTGDNMYLYRDSDGIFHYIPWDMNQAFGNYHPNPASACYHTTQEMIELDPDATVCDPGNRPLVESVLAVPAFADSYRGTLRSLIGSAGALEADSTIADSNAMKAFIQASAAEDALLGPFDAADFDSSFTSDLPSDPGDPGYADRIPGLRSFIEARDAYLQGVLGG